MSETIEIIVKPSELRHQFEASLEDRVLCTSQTPFCDSARILLKEGVNPDLPLIMRHLGSSTVALKSTVGIAAGLTVADDGIGFKRLGSISKKKVKSTEEITGNLRRRNLTWIKDGNYWSLQRRGSKELLTRIVPDSQYPNMWRIELDEGKLSDMVNLTRARDAAIAVALKAFNRKH